MATQKTNSSEYCAGLINCASLILRLHHDEIVDQYSDNAMFVKDYIEKGVHEKIIDIVFEDEKATLACTFDENNGCNISYIFLDNLDEVGSYIAYLKNEYDYDYIRNCWLLPNSYLSIKSTEDDIYFESFY